MDWLFPVVLFLIVVAAGLAAWLREKPLYVPEDWEVDDFWPLGEPDWDFPPRGR